MLIKHRETEPTIEDSAWVAPTAVVIGDVSVGPDARVMYGAVINAEASSVAVGDTAIVCENAVVRATKTQDEEHQVQIEDHTFVGPHATLLGCRIGRAAYIATGATVLQGARVGDGAVVAVGALVHAGAVVPDGGFVPPNMTAIGDPMEIYGSQDPNALTQAIVGVGFLERAFGVSIGWEDRVGRYIQASEIRAAEFAAHKDDVPLGQ